MTPRTNSFVTAVDLDLGYDPPSGRHLTRIVLTLSNNRREILTFAKGIPTRCVVKTLRARADSMEKQQ